MKTLLQGSYAYFAKAAEERVLPFSSCDILITSTLNKDFFPAKHHVFWRTATAIMPITTTAILPIKKGNPHFEPALKILIQGNPSEALFYLSQLRGRVQMYCFEQSGSKYLFWDMVKLSSAIRSRIGLLDDFFILQSLLGEREGIPGIWCLLSEKGIHRILQMYHPSSFSPLKEESNFNRFLRSLTKKEEEWLAEDFLKRGNMAKQIREASSAFLDKENAPLLFREDEIYVSPGEKGWQKRYYALMNGSEDLCVQYRNAVLQLDPYPFGNAPLLCDLSENKSIIPESKEMGSLDPWIWIGCRYLRQRRLRNPSFQKGNKIDSTKE